MNSKNFSLPQVEARLIYNNSNRHEVTELAMAGGREPESAWLKNLVTQNTSLELYAADKGAKYFLGNNLVPKLVLGDADSAGKELFQEAELKGSTVILYPSEKDDTDFQLLLNKLPVSDVIISGVWGGRFDHLYSIIFSLTEAARKKLGFIIMADHEELMFFLKPEEKLELSFKAKHSLEAISLLPLTENTKVSLKGVHWPLEEHGLSMYKPYAISNVLEENNELCCSCQEGIVGLYCCFNSKNNN